MNKAGTDRQPDYAITHMMGGGFRAECLVPDCGWWEDTLLFNDAERVLRAHVGIHPGIVWEPRRAEVSKARPRKDRT
jgi:hypothetical protein